MNEKLKNLSPKQKELLIKKLNLDFGKVSHIRNGKLGNANIKKPFGHVIPISNFNKIECKNYEISPPGPYQIQVQAKAISLNFRDIMIGLGLYPNVEGIPSIMGGDYAGEVVACGEKVEDFKVGDEVISLYGGDTENNLHFSSLINAYTFQTVLKPEHLSFEEASCIPTAFLTSYYGLYHLGNLSENETVLIHTASGGVGLAAIQIAKWRKAIIFGTAGNEKKRAFLRSLGINYVMNSRSLEFYDQILEQTDKAGVDIILNTLSGEAVEKGMQLLSNLGRFIQLDKTDITKNRLIDLNLFKKSTSFIFVDLSQFHMNPKLRFIFTEVYDLFKKRIFSPLPFRQFSYLNLTNALSFMAMGKHIGKIVLSFEGQ